MSKLNAYEYTLLADHLYRNKETYQHLRRSQIVKHIADHTTVSLSTPVKDGHLVYIKNYFPDCKWIGADPRKKNTARVTAEDMQVMAIAVKDLYEREDPLSETCETLDALIHRYSDAPCPA